MSVTVNQRDRLRIDPAFRGYRRCEPDSWSVFLDDVHAGDLMVDVGANVGLYSIAAAKRGAEVVAFEPDGFNARTLRRHARMNRVRERVQVIEAAVGEGLGALPFAVRGSPVSGAADLYLGATTDFKVVPVLSLDAVLYGRKIDLMKVDVEGMEGSVLRGATQLLNDPKRRPRILLIEVHEPVLHMRGESWEQLRASLPGYEWSALGSNGGDRWLGRGN
jgi:FkbM family methyltransferase